jgi:hypothetical protein
LDPWRLREKLATLVQSCTAASLGLPSVANPLDACVEPCISRPVAYLLGDVKQPSQTVDRGKGTVTLTESFVVPAGSNEVRLFIPLVPSGISDTSGELVIRYPLSDHKESSSIGYPSVAAALADLHLKPDMKFSVQNGWTIAEDRSHFTLWSFAPAGDPAYPSAVKRTAVQEAGGRVTMDMKVLCQSTQSACDKLVADFNALNERMRDSFKSK